MSYVIKDSYNNSHHKIETYYHVSGETIHWTTEQKKAQRFNSRLDAWAVADTLNRNGSSVRVVKLVKPKLIVPKPGTVFLDLMNGVPVPNLVSEIYEDYDDEDPSVLPETYVFTLNLVTPGREDSFCTLKEYNRFLKNYDITIIWEPV